MKRYFVSKSVNGNATTDYEIHVHGCPNISLGNSVDLGLNLNNRSALREAFSQFKDVNGCIRCIPEYHYS